MEMDQQPEEPLSLKKGRHRKKQLYNLILQQMEFYFSDSNLTKDRFLSQLIQTDPYINIDTFLKFNKIRKLTTNIDDIAKAITKSNLIEISEDKTKVQRKVPIIVKENVDSCTIYVERLKSDVTHDWLTTLFSEFGKVVYVSIPKYKHNGIIKGFAFVEFETEEGCKAALDYFESIDCKISSHIEPQHLCSIATYEGDTKNKKSELKDENSTEDDAVEENVMADVNNVPKNNTDGKKRKHCETNTNEVEEEENALIKKKCEDEQVINESDITEEEMQEEKLEGDEKKKKKTKKSHKKKTSLKEIGLQILSKKDWKRMRNRYLDMQRKNMKQLKMHLNKKYASNKKKEPVKENKAKEVEKQPPGFIQGIIVKVALTQPCEDNKKLKNEIKACSSEIKYVDIPLPGGSTEVFVRFSDNKHAQAFCQSDFSKGETGILEEQEEKEYWERIESAREAKQKRSNVKQRGRDKLLKKAEQAAKHIRFDDNE